MVPMKIEFSVVKVRAKDDINRIEFSVICRINDLACHTLTTFPTCPTDMIVGEIKELVLRSMYIYHQHIEFPRFQLVEVM